jgi:predicted ATPase/DNA-binding XRE family transcriptional regulator
MLEQQSFGYWLRLKRKALDLTLEGLADRVGCSASTIRKLEDEERRPSTQIAERLADIFNIPQTERASFLRFARGNQQAAPMETKEAFPWYTSSKSPRSNIPATLTSLIGREKEIADIREYLLKADIRLVTLIGPPGIGKTRLSIESARAALSDFPEGVFFVALAPLNDPNLIPQTVAQSLGYVQASNLPIEGQLQEGIGNKRMLIVLDNCEHLIEAAASLASSLLSSCSRLKILATSRESFRITGEWLYRVPAFDISEEVSSITLESASNFPALTLFAERARAVEPAFSLNAENIQMVSAICAHLDGLPLAIELIAARIRLMSPQVLLERLSSPFVLAAAGMRDAADRQKTLNNAIGWSYNFLSEEEKQLFAQLAVFSGGFTLETAETIFSQTVKEKSVTEIITSLLDKSLLQRTFKANDGNRFNMLVTIQQFALERLRNMGGEIATRNRHMMYFIAFTEKIETAIHGPDQAKLIDYVESEYDNLHSALNWCVSQSNANAALRLLCALGWPWEIRGHYVEARDWLDKIRGLPNLSGHPTIYAKVLNHIGRYSWTQHQRNDALALLEESQIISQRLGNDGEQILAETLNWLGLVMRTSTDPEKAKTLFTRGLELYQKLDNQRGIALSTFHLGVLEGEMQHEDVALFQLEKSLSLFRQIGDLFFIARVSLFLGHLCLNLGNYDKAHLHFEEHLRIDQELQFWDGIADGWRDLGNLYHYQGKYDQARQHYEESVTVCREHGLNKFHVYYLSGLLALHDNNYPLAFQHFIFPLDLAHRSGELAHVSVLIMGLAAVAAGMKQHERASKLYGMAQEIIEMTDYRIHPFNRTEFDRHIQIVRRQLGEERFEALCAEGRAMTMEQSIEYALEISTG